MHMQQDFTLLSNRNSRNSQDMMSMLIDNKDVINGCIGGGGGIYLPNDNRLTP
jgi:hypothetical protein